MTELKRCILRRFLIKIGQAALVLLLGAVLWIGLSVLVQWIDDGLAGWKTLLKEAFALVLLLIGLPSLLFGLLVSAYRESKKECGQ